MRADFAFAIDPAEERWTRNFADAISDPEWSANRNAFDGELLFGRVPPDSVPESIRRGDGDRKIERLARCSNGGFICAHEVCYEWISDSVLRTSPKLPAD